MAFGEEWGVSEYAEKYKEEHPIYAPQGTVTRRDPTIFTEEEVRDMPTWEESVTDSEARGELRKGRHLIADSTPMIVPENVAKVSRIMIKVKEPKGDVYYYALDPVKGGKKGTEVDMVKEGLAGKKSFPGAVKIPNINLPNWKLPSLPSLEFPAISGLTKGIVGLVLLFIAGIVLLIAVGYSGLGGSAGRVGETEYKRRRK